MDCSDNDIEIIRVILKQRQQRKASNEESVKKIQITERSFCAFKRLSIIGRNLEDLRFPFLIRMTATQYEKLVGYIAPEVHKEILCNGEFIGAAECLFLTLRLLATGDSIDNTMNAHGINVEGLEKIVFSTCKAIYKVLKPLVMYPDFTIVNWLKLEQEINKLTEFPHCVGVVGGRHVITRFPAHVESEDDYVQSNLVVFLAICDANFMFNYVDVRPYGDRHSTGIFRDSFLGKKIMNRELNLPCSFQTSGTRNPLNDLPYCLIGNQSFPLKTRLLRPYSNVRRLELSKRIFNYRLSRAENIAENCFGIIYSKWSIFSKPIDMLSCTVEWMTRACTCLHNWLRINDLNGLSLITYMPPELIDRVENNVLRPGNWRRITRYYTGFRNMNIIDERRAIASEEAMQTRYKYATYFMNEGSVNWQNGVFLEV